MEKLTPVRVLSIRQPWAWLIVNGHKGIENRNWDTQHRGRFLVHAGQGMTKAEYTDCRDFCLYDMPPGKAVVLPKFEELERGGIVGEATLINTVHESHQHLLTSRDEPWFFGAYGFVLDNQKPRPFKPLKGRLGFFWHYDSALYSL